MDIYEQVVHNIFSANNNQEFIDAFIEFSNQFEDVTIDDNNIANVNQVLLLSGRQIKEYLEDFDFVVNHFAQYAVDDGALYGFNAELFRDSYRNKIENYFNMNDQIFFILLRAALALDTAHYVPLPFEIIPYDMLIARIQSEREHNQYIVSPNDVLAIVYDLQGGH